MIQSGWSTTLSIFLVRNFLLIIGAAGSCMLQLSTFPLFGSAFSKKGYSSPCRVSIKVSELKSVNINREHIYHSSIVNYRLWYLCASGKPRDITGYRISGLGFKERRKPLEK
uniref:Secreted protein n=1 Tax=Saimiri boliviensis boliviensis TaxID=39432 RepID=A0A2K6TND5_SAIBB